MEKACTRSFGACIGDSCAPKPLQRTFLYSDRRRHQEEAWYVQHKVLRYIISHTRNEIPTFHNNLQIVARCQIPKLHTLNAKT
jgi:hypothetical protein